MGWYLKWPADSGTAVGNNKLCQISGVALSGTVNVAIEFAEDVIPPTTNSTRGAYLYDGRRTLDSTVAGTGGVLLKGNGGYSQANIGTHRLNGAVSGAGGWETALDGDIYSFNTVADDGVIAIGSKYDGSNHFSLAAIRAITITDNNGTHTIDMSDSGGTANEFTSTDGILTLKLFNFTGGQWVYEGAGGGGEEVIQAQNSGGTVTASVTTITNSAFINKQVIAVSAETNGITSETVSATTKNNQSITTNGAATAKTNANPETSIKNRQQAASNADIQSYNVVHSTTSITNSQNQQSTGQAVSVADYIASTSWVNTIDMGNVQHRQTSGSAEQAFSSTAQATAKNCQHRQTSGKTSTATTFVATNSWVNTVLLIAAYTRHIKTRSTLRKNYQTSTRHSYRIKSGSNQ
jgi:hypothetical protein